MVNNTKLSKEAYNKIVNPRHTVWSIQGRKTSTFKRNPDGCGNHKMGIFDVTGTSTYCVYCNHVEYSQESKPNRSNTNENSPKNRQILHSAKPKQTGLVKVYIRMTP